MAGYGMKKMAEGGMTGRPKTMGAAMKKVEKSAADRRLDKMAGVKEGSAKDIRADKMQAKNVCYNLRKGMSESAAPGAVVACDKPPVGTLAALLEHNQPAIIMSDGSIHPGHDPKTGETIDLVTAYQVAGHPDAEYRHHIACHACPGYGSCGGMFTYNTMQTFIGVVGMQPLHMVAPPSDDPRRTSEFADQLVGYLAELIKKNLRPRDIVGRDSLRNAVIVAMAVGGSTNVVLHAPEIARAAGFADFWKEVMTPEEFNYLSQHLVPVLTDLLQLHPELRKAETLAQLPAVRARDARYCNTLFARILREYPVYVDVCAADPQGRIFARGATSGVPAELTAPEVLREAIEQKLWDEVGPQMKNAIAALNALRSQVDAATAMLEGR